MREVDVNREDEMPSGIEWEAEGVGEGMVENLSLKVVRCEGGKVMNNLQKIRESSRHILTFKAKRYVGLSFKIS